MADNKQDETTTPVQPTDEGKDKDTKTKMVPESDLLAIKASRESLQTQFDGLKEQTRTQVSELGVRLAAAEAKAAESEEHATKLTTAEEELKTTKAALEAAQTSGEGHRAKALEYRRTLIAASFNVPADTMKEKTMEQLDSFEEALKAVGGIAKGTGYAAGGGGGAAPAPELPMDRARRIIQETEEKQGIVRVSEKKDTP